jgi:hypothetical protein
MSDCQFYFDGKIKRSKMKMTELFLTFIGTVRKGKSCTLVILP